MTSPASIPLYERIAGDVLRRVAAGELRPGDRLPPVREAARAWGVNLNTVARAYGLLAQRGVLDTRAGGGTVVAAAPAEPNPWGADPVAEARAERLRAALTGPVLTSLGLGYSPAEIEAAVSMALARWRPAEPTGDALGAPAPADEVPVDDAPGSAIRFVGSHDLSLELLAGRLRVRLGGVAGDPVLHLTSSGSLEGLFALAHGAADVAGCHLRDPESGDENLPFVRRVLPGESLLLVTLAHREQGLVVQPGNPKALTSVADLARREVTFVNRQRGAGTRVLLDELLARENVQPDDVRGYDHEEATHLAVAGAVASGAADVGLAIRAAARAFGLDFVTIARERYELVLRPATAERATVRALFDTLADPDFQAAVRSLGGYDTAETGQSRRT